MPRVHTQIFIADPHVLYRRGLRTVLSNEPDFHVTHDDSSLEELLAKVVIRTELNSTYPDALLVCKDLMTTCTERQTQFLKEFQSRSVVLTLCSELQSSEPDTILKGNPPAAIVKAVREAVEFRRTGFAQSLSALQKQTEVQGPERVPALTSRELEIVRLLSEGLTARDTARELNLSIKTVEAHKLNIMRKLGVHKRAELLSYVEQNGIIQPVAAA